MEALGVEIIPHTCKGRGKQRDVQANQFGSRGHHEHLPEPANTSRVKIGNPGPGYGRAAAKIPAAPVALPDCGQTMLACK